MTEAANLSGDDASGRLDDVVVRADAAAVAAFRRAACFEEDGEAVPATFPFRWLTLPVVRPTLSRMIGDGVVPVHEAQSFAYERPLALDAEYRVGFVFRRSSAPDRLTVTASIETPDRQVCGGFEMVLRLVATTPKDSP